MCLLAILILYYIYLYSYIFFQADRVFYLGYDLYPRDNPRFHHADLYSYAAVEGQNKLRTPQMNNVTLRVKTVDCLIR